RRGCGGSGPARGAAGLRTGAPAVSRALRAGTKRLFAPRVRREVEVHAEVGEKRHFLAVGEADDDLAALLADFEVGAFHRLDGVDRGARVEGAADFDGRGVGLVSRD